jgi:hypothetical protein
VAFSIDWLLSGVQVIFVKVCRDKKVIRSITVFMNSYGAIVDMELTAQLNIPNPLAASTESASSQPNMAVNDSSQLTVRILGFVATVGCLLA